MEEMVSDDDQFVTIDLDDEFEECDICHQATVEAIVHVVLDDLFTIYDGSYEKRSGRPTKAHQVCLDRWSDIIRRNLKSSKNQTLVKNYINGTSTTTNQKNYRIDRSPHRTTNYTNDYMNIIPMRICKEYNTLPNRTHNGEYRTQTGEFKRQTGECKIQTGIDIRDNTTKHLDVTSCREETRNINTTGRGCNDIESEGKCLYDERCLIVSGRCSCSKEVGRKTLEECKSIITDLLYWQCQHAYSILSIF